MIGNLIGSGFLMMPAVLSVIGINSVYSWFFAFVIAFVFSIVFGRLAMINDKVRVLSDYFKSHVIRQSIAVVYWLSCVIGNTGILIITVSGLGLNMNYTATTLMLFLTLMVHFLKYDMLTKIEVLMSAVKFGLLLVMPIAFYLLKPELFIMPAAQGSVWQVSRLGISCFWSFLGIEIASVFGKGKEVMIGLLSGVAACFILYVITTLIIIGGVSSADLQSNAISFTLLVNNFFGHEKYQFYINLLSCFVAFVALYGWVTATGKMALSYSSTGVFPKIFSKKTVSGMSLVGLWLANCISLVVLFFISDRDAMTQFCYVSELCVYVTLLIYVFCSWVLFMESKNIIDKVVSVIGSLLVGVIFWFDLKLAIIATVILFGYLVFNWLRLYRNTKNG